MKIFDKIFNKNKIIKRDVKTFLISKTDKDIKLDYKFEFNFFKDFENNKKAMVSVNEEKVVLNKDEYCIFQFSSKELKLYNSNPIRLKIKPDFKNEGCQATMCYDPEIEDSDI